MANIFKASFNTTVEIIKTAASVGTQVAASYTTAWDVVKDNSEYVKTASESTFGSAFSNDRAQAANRSVVAKLKAPWKDETTVESASV